MKIVINRCFGGFGLSKRAMFLYAELAGVKIYFEPRPDAPASLAMGTYWIVPPDQRPKPILDWCTAPLEERRAYNEAYSKATIYEKDLKRDDPFLVAAVEQLGDDADGSCADLKIVEIPDGIEWHIEEYDGREHVAEDHRTWP